MRTSTSSNTDAKSKPSGAGRRSWSIFGRTTCSGGAGRSRRAPRARRDARAVDRRWESAVHSRRACERTGPPRSIRLPCRVISDQGILAERAWALPYELAQRLGHLDPKRLADDPDAVREAFAQIPKLHRFVNDVPRWLSQA